MDIEVHSMGLIMFFGSKLLEDAFVSDSSFFYGIYQQVYTISMTTFGVPTKSSGTTYEML
jgi:hypothetical protein